MKVQKEVEKVPAKTTVVDGYVVVLPDPPDELGRLCCLAMLGLTCCQDRRMSQ